MAKPKKREIIEAEANQVLELLKIRPHLSTEFIGFSLLEYKARIALLRRKGWIIKSKGYKVGVRRFALLGHKDQRPEQMQLL